MIERHLPMLPLSKECSLAPVLESARNRWLEVRALSSVFLQLLNALGLNAAFYEGTATQLFTLR